MPGTPRSVPRRSAAKVPMPHARGGYVETIAVRMRAVLRAHAGRRRKRFDALRPLQPGADRRSLAQPFLGRRAQPVQGSPEALSHHVAPSRDSPETASGGLVWESEHGDAHHTVAHTRPTPDTTTRTNEGPAPPGPLDTASVVELRDGDDVAVRNDLAARDVRSTGNHRGEVLIVDPLRRDLS